MTLALVLFWAVVAPFAVKFCLTTTEADDDVELGSCGAVGLCWPLVVLVIILALPLIGLVKLWKRCL